MSEEYNELSVKGSSPHVSSEELKQLMEQFGVNEEDMNLAIRMVGNRRDKLENYLSLNASARTYNIW